MNRTLAITSLIAIGVTGYLIGKNAGTPAPVSVEKKITPEEQPTTTELISSLSETKSEATSYQLRRQLESLPFSELESAFAKLVEADKAETHLNDLKLRLALEILIARDPHATIALIGKHFTSLKKAHAYSNLIEDWGRADPHATLEFLHTLDQDNIHNATTGFLYSWAANDPKTALETWLALPDPKLPNPSTVDYGSECLALGAAQNPDLRQTALTMLLDQPESEARSSAIAGVLKIWAANADFTQVTEWFEAQQFDPTATGKIAVALATTAAQNENQIAPDWLHQQIKKNIPDKHDRANLLDSFTEEWARESPNACAAWLAKLKPSPETDWAIRGFLRQVEFQDPEAAFHWTRKINTPHLRERLAKELWVNWRRKAPIASSKFVPELDESEQIWLKRSI